MKTKVNSVLIVVAAAVAAGDSQAGGKGDLKQPIQQALGTILRAMKKHNRAFHSRNGHNLYRHFLSESAMANPHLGLMRRMGVRADRFADSTQALPELGNIEA